MEEVMTLGVLKKTHPPLSSGGLTLWFQCAAVCLSLVYSAFLLGQVSATDVSRIVFVLIASEILAIMICSVPRIEQPVSQTPGDPVRAPSEGVRAVLRLFLWFGLIVVLVTVSPVPILDVTPFAVFALVTMSLLAASCHLIRIRTPEGQSLVPELVKACFLRLMLGSGLVVLVQHYWSLTIDTVLALHCVAGLACVFLRLAFRKRPHSAITLAIGHGRHRKRTSFAIDTVVSRYGDLLIIGWVLPPHEILIYSFARGWVLFMEIILNNVVTRVEPMLPLSDGSLPHRAFKQAAARINLGLFLFGCGAALAVLAIAPVCVRAMSDGLVFQMPVLHWVLLGGSVPAIFGATHLFLDKRNLHIAQNALTWASAVLVLGLPIVLDVRSAVEFASVFAGVHLFIGAIGACLVAWKLQVLPGFTAVLHPQLRMT